MVQRRDKLP